jgi:Domain of unknown function (DUF4168)
MSSSLSVLALSCSKLHLSFTQLQRTQPKHPQKLSAVLGVLGSLSIGIAGVFPGDAAALAQTMAQSGQSPSLNPTTSPTNTTGRPGSPASPSSSGSSPSSNFNPNFISNLQVSKYARAVLEIEQVRQKFQHQAIQVLGKTLPTNTCVGNYRANVPPGLENICNGYLQESRAIVDKYGLTPEEFNAITLRSRNDSALFNRIQQELGRWQRQRVANPASPRPAGTRP